ncbi:hypothetical protein MTR_3g046830 [Medicago truncatula]|uniref:Uncharacterized protein n=1 Tax=Medicago truncatula TaxID=3880 RepID=G7IXG1_MEDTR|nr:hypothetical protein MTR_3g046830 [Medicago truncatula]
MTRQSCCYRQRLNGYKALESTCMDHSGFRSKSGFRQTRFLEVEPKYQNISYKRLKNAVYTLCLAEKHK